MNANVHSKQPVSRVALQQHGSQVMVIVAAQRGGGGGAKFFLSTFHKTPFIEWYFQRRQAFEICFWLTFDGKIVIKSTAQMTSSYCSL